MAAPVHQAQSAIAADATPHADLTVTLPAHQTNDIFLMTVVVRGQGDSATVSGWTQLATVDRSTVSRYWWFWKRAASGSESNPVVDFTDTTGDAYAIVVVYRGANASGDPFEVKGTPQTGTADPASLTGITALTNESLIIAALAGEDNNNFGPTVWSATNPTSLTSRYVETGTGTDAMFDVAEGAQATAGETGTISGNFDVAAPGGWGALILALKPVAGTNFNQSTGGHTLGPTSTETRNTTKQGGGFTESPVGALSTLLSRGQTVGGFTEAPTGALRRASAKSGGGFTESPAGTLQRQSSKASGGYVLGPGGALLRAAGKAAGGHILSSSGAVQRATQRAAGGYQLAISSTLTAELTGEPQEFLQSCGGFTLNPTGTLVLAGQPAVTSTVWVIYQRTFS